MSEPQEPKIIVDSDWKSRVETEKEAIRQQEKKPDAEAPGELLGMPPASIPVLVSTLATQALVALGQIPDPFSGKPELNLPVARHFIDTLDVLQEKTRGNLNEDEAAMLTDVLHQLRMAFVAIQTNSPPGPSASSLEIP